MATPAFEYKDPFPLAKDETRYRLVSKEGVSVSTFEGREILKVAPEALTTSAVRLPPVTRAISPK